MRTGSTAVLSSPSLRGAESSPTRVPFIEPSSRTVTVLPSEPTKRLQCLRDTVEKHPSSSVMLRFEHPLPIRSSTPNPSSTLLPDGNLRKTGRASRCVMPAGRNSSPHCPHRCSPGPFSNPHLSQAKRLNEAAEASGLAPSTPDVPLPLCASSSTELPSDVGSGISVKNVGHQSSPCS